MEAISSLVQLGMGGAALLALIVIIFKMLDLLQAMNTTITTNTQVTTALKDNIEKNTVATNAMVNHLQTLYSPKK